MTIPSVVQGLVELENGKVFELDSPKGTKWLESVNSFRYEPTTGANKPYTVRQEAKKGGDYWYAYRKVAGKLHKRYIGATSSLSVPKLEEIAEALNTSQQTRVTEKVTQIVTYKPADDEFAALKVQVQALQESLETLRDELLGKPQIDDALESPETVTQVTDKGLLIKLGNFKVENEALRQELIETKQQYLALLENSAKQIKELQTELFDAKAIIASLDPSPVVGALRLEIDRLQTEVETCKEQPVAEIELPEAAELLNRLKAKRKKATASLADVEALLEMIG